MTFSETLVVEPVAPFDFDLSAQIFRRGDSQIRTFRECVFSQVLRLKDTLPLVKLTSKGKVDQPKIVIEIKSNSFLTSFDKQSVLDAVKFIFNLDLDLCSFYDEVKNDATMQRIVQQLYGLRSPTTSTVFESLVDSIVEQQISILVAVALEEKLVKKFGDRLEIDGETFFAFPTPQAFAAASVEEIQGVGLSRRKAEYIKGAAMQIVGGKLDLEHLMERKSADEIICELDAVRGIGVWTAELTMLRGMQRLDVLPADDLGLRRVISRYYCGGRVIKADEARLIGEVWGKWKGLAAFYLIVAEAKGIQA